MLPVDYYYLALRIKLNLLINFLNQGFGNMYINTSGIDVLGRIESDGNVFYKGIPALFNVQEFGKGKFLNLE